MHICTSTSEKLLSIRRIFQSLPRYPIFLFAPHPVCIMCVLVGNRLRKPRETKTADPCDMENSKKEEKKLESKLATNWIVPPSNGKTGRKGH